MTTDSDAWLPYGIRRPGASMRLFCLPYAGGSASAYRNWAASLPLHIEALPVQLPGRETRLREPCITSVPLLVQALAEGLHPFLDRPFALFGHSFGALVGFELCRHLRRRGLRPAGRLFVSARAAPHLPARRPPIHHLADDDLVAELYRLEGTPVTVLECEELMRLVLPTVRADFTAAESYGYRSEDPLACPIIAFAGVGDAEVSLDEVDAWRNHTSQPFSQTLVPGGHFFPFEATDVVLEGIVESLERT